MLLKSECMATSKAVGENTYIRGIRQLLPADLSQIVLDGSYINYIRYTTSVFSSQQARQVVL